jgi:hypothetical protein
VPEGSQPVTVAQARALEDLISAPHSIVTGHYAISDSVENILAAYQNGFFSETHQQHISEVTAGENPWTRLDLAGAQDLLALQQSYGNNVVTLNYTLAGTLDTLMAANPEIFAAASNQGNYWLTDDTSAFTNRPVTDLLTPAQLEMISYAQNGDTFAPYKLHDTLDHLYAAGPTVIGNLAYSLSDGSTAFSDLSVANALTVDEKSMLDYATNSADYVYSLKDSLTNLMAAGADILSNANYQYSLSDANTAFENLAVNEALTYQEFRLLQLASNSNDYTYKLHGTMDEFVQYVDQGNPYDPSFILTDSNTSAYTDLPVSGKLTSSQYQVWCHALNNSDYPYTLKGTVADLISDPNLLGNITGYTIVDTAENILAGLSSDSNSIQGATAVVLSSDATLTVSQKSTLTDLTSLDLNGHHFTVLYTLAELGAAVALPTEPFGVLVEDTPIYTIADQIGTDVAPLSDPNFSGTVRLDVDSSTRVMLDSHIKTLDLNGHQLSVLMTNAELNALQITDTSASSTGSIKLSSNDASMILTDTQFSYLSGLTNAFDESLPFTVTSDAPSNPSTLFTVTHDTNSDQFQLQLQSDGVNLSTYRTLQNVDYLNGGFNFTPSSLDLNGHNTELTYDQYVHGFSNNVSNPSNTDPRITDSTGIGKVTVMLGANDNNITTLPFSPFLASIDVGSEAWNLSPDGIADDLVGVTTSGEWNWDEGGSHQLTWWDENTSAAHTLSLDSHVTSVTLSSDAHTFVIV